jgi:5-hydroxyisourate hydrolase-like protein (transthyretin family)
VTTNADGRAGASLLEGDALRRGSYRLVFDSET